MSLAALAEGDFKHYIPVATPENEGPIACFQVLQGVSRALMEFNPTFCTRERWLEFIYNVKYGLIKETKEFGTSSVSQGLGVSLAASQSLSSLVLANCGTGGAKFQPFITEPYCRVTSEMKGGQDAPNPNALGDLTSFGSSDWDTQRANVKKAADELANEMERLKIETPKVFTFITGPLREYVCKSSHDTKFFNDKVKELFQNDKVEFVPFDGENYFLTQEREAEYELQGVQSMYQNICIAGYIDQCNVIASFGIGRGSSQLGDCLVAVGMNQASTLAQTVIDAFKKCLDDGYAKRLMNQETQEGVIIALKSGVVMLIDKNPQLFQAIKKQEEERKPVRFHVPNREEPKNTKRAKDVDEIVKKLSEQVYKFNSDVYDGLEEINKRMKDLREAVASSSSY